MLHVAELNGKTPEEFVLSMMALFAWPEDDEEEKSLIADRIAAANRGELLTGRRDARALSRDDEPPVTVRWERRAALDLENRR